MTIWVDRTGHDGPVLVGDDLAALESFAAMLGLSYEGRRHAELDAVVYQLDRSQAARAIEYGAEEIKDKDQASIMAIVQAMNLPDYADRPHADAFVVYAWHAWLLYTDRSGSEMAIRLIRVRLRSEVPRQVNYSLMCGCPECTVVREWLVNTLGAHPRWMTDGGH